MNPENFLDDDSSPASKLYNDVQIEGTLSFSKTFEFEGSFKGKVISSGTFVVGKQGKIDGEIKTDSIVIQGSVTGNIVASNKCVLKSTCSVNGDIKSSKVSMEEGAEFMGNVSVDRSV